jgi:hypothetical protein
MDLTGVTWRWYPGDEAQLPDPFILAKMGAASTPAYRGTAYVVFEELPLARFGNRLPQLSFEVFAPIADPDTAEGLVRAVTMIPASGEFVYATQGIRKGGGDSSDPDNLHALADTADMVVALDRLQASVPAVESVSLVVSWFGDDLRAGAARIRPGVELAAKTTVPKTWSVNGVARANAHLVSRDTENRPVFGGTPADFAVVQAIQEMRARGLRVTLSPFILMDVPPGNLAPNPYSDNAAGIGQPAFPWRGRITVSPAAGYAGSVDKTAAAATQVAAFFGAATPSEFTVAGETVSWTGPADDWGLRRMVLHYAHLCAAAGGVDAFLVGSEMRGLTQVRDGAASYPAVAALRALAADVRAILGPSTKIGYAADWSEYFGHHPAPDEILEGGVFDDPAAGAHWTRSPVNAAVIDYTATGVELTPASTAFADRAQAFQRVTTVAGAAYQIRVSVTEVPAGAFGLYLLPFDSSAGLALIGGVDDYQATAAGEHLFTTTAPSTSTDLYFRLTGTIGTARIASISLKPASGDVRFHLDPLWADAEIDFVGIDNYMPLSDWRDGLDHLDGQDGWASIHDRAYLQSNIAGGEGFDWFYASEANRAAQIRTPITDGGEAVSATGSSDPPNGKPWVFRYKDLRAWWSNPHHDRPGGVESAMPTAWVPEGKPIRFTELGCPAIDRGTNQPNVFVDPKSSESVTPHFSRGWRDDAIQRAYLEATYLWWGIPANNPVSSVYGGPMVHVPECVAWTWDARPYPFFPELSDVWTDGANWRRGHWLTGRLGAVSLAALVRHLSLRAGLPEAMIDVSGLWGAVEGYAITALESPRASIAPLARHFGFDAVETEGVIRFMMRGRAAVATVTPDDLVAPNAGSGARDGDVLELTRGQETELPQALKWQVARADEDYDAAVVEARRITPQSARIASETFPMAVPPEEAERRARRALMEAWIGREAAAFRLAPSRLALDPADVIRLEHDGREVELRLVSIADAEARGVEAVRQDREAYDLPPGQARTSTLTRAIVFGPPVTVLMDLPQLGEDQPAHRPLVAAHAVPWPGEIAVLRSPATDGFELLTTFGSRARIGALAFDFWPGPVSRFDLGNALVIDLLSGTLESVTDLTLFGGANALAVESAPGAWEIVQAGMAELIAKGRYRLTRLLRGQRGTEGAMGSPAPAGARVVVLDASLASLPITEADLGLPWNWRIGPASRPVSDETYVAQSFTPAGAGLRPFSVAHVEQPWRRPRSPGDLTIRWTRRSRALSADSWGAVEAPLAEEAEAYEVEVLDGATVKRVLNAVITSAVYTAADQTADWGALLGPGDSLAIRIFQLSALIGRGAPKTVTLSF